MNTINQSDETLEKWKAFLEEYRIRTEKKKEHDAVMDRIKSDPNYEKYREAVNGDKSFKEDSQSFISLFLIHKHLEETPQEIIQAEFDAVKDIGGDSPTVEEYFEALNPHAMYVKGATEFKNELLNYFEDDERVMIPLSEVIMTIKDLYEGK